MHGWELKQLALVPMILLPAGAYEWPLGADLLFGWDWLASDRLPILKEKSSRSVMIWGLKFTLLLLHNFLSSDIKNLQWSRLCPLCIIESYRDECLQNSDSPSFWETSRCSFAVGASANSWLHWWIYVFTQESGKLSDWTARRNATASATCSKIDRISTRKRKISTNG